MKQKNLISNEHLFTQNQVLICYSYSKESDKPTLQNRQNEHFQQARPIRHTF